MRSRVLLTLPIREGNNYQVSPDLGQLCVGTVLHNNGSDVRLLDCPKEQFTFKDYKTYIQEGNFDVIGFRCYSRDHNYVNHHLNIARQVNPNVVTLIGGPHPSALPEYVLQTMPNLDYAWKAEAEEGFPQLLSCLTEYGRDIPEDLLRTVPGLAWRSKEEQRVVVNAPSFGLDLDSYGIPAWELIRPETYPGFIWDEYYPILTTRGCPYPCTYCNTPGLSGKKLRHRSVDQVIEELKLLKRRYHIGRFSIIDDEFTLDWRYATRFCEALLDSNLNLKWDCPVGVRLDSLYPELLKVMEAAGCEALAVGIESGSERIQKLIKKRVTVETIKERAHMIAGCTGIKITGYFMIGFLDETEEEIWETIDLAAALPLVRANFNIVIPIPGTVIFDECLNLGKLKVSEINWDDLTSDQIAFSRNHLTGSRLLKLQTQAYLRFYGRPQIVWELGRDALRNREVVRASLRKVKMLFARKSSRTFTPMYQREAYV